MEIKTVVGKSITFYMISSPSTEKVYIGSTANFNQRRSQHVSEYKRYSMKSGRKYCTSFEIIKYNDYIFSIIKIENITIKEDRYKVEGTLIKQHNSVNRLIAGRTRRESNKEYKKKNKDKIKKINIEYYHLNKDKINKKRNVKYTCECGGCYTHTHRSSHFKTIKHINHQALTVE